MGLYYNSLKINEKTKIENLLNEIFGYSSDIDEIYARFYCVYFSNKFQRTL